jgi:hypothetical protein
VSIESNPTANTATREWALGRRDFLILGTAAAAGVAATSLAAGTISTIVTPAAGSILSVGFVERLQADAMVKGAARFRQADAEFLRSGARVTVLGAFRPEALAKAPVSIRLSAFYPHVGEQGPLPFLAWSQSLSLRGVLNVSGSASFTAPLDENGTLPISVERVDLTPSRFGRLFASATPGVAAEARPNLASLQSSGNVCRLTGGNSGDVRLREGTYFIALRRANSDRAPNWSSISIQGDEVSAPGGVLRNGDRPVPFEYIALSLKYATA